jgi:hypothetical protein
MMFVAASSYILTSPHSKQNFLTFLVRFFVENNQFAAVRIPTPLEQKITEFRGCKKSINGIAAEQTRVLVEHP